MQNFMLFSNPLKKFLKNVPKKVVSKNVTKICTFSTFTHCSVQTQTGIGLLGKPPAVKQFPSVESHLGVRASTATQDKRRYEANKCG
jgi:hypothetical protein